MCADVSGHVACVLPYFHVTKYMRPMCCTLDAHVACTIRVKAPIKGIS